MNLDDLFYFVRAVEAGGFAAAARRLSCPKSTISKRVAELEKTLAARLVERSSRSFTLTDIGREVFEHARAAVAEAEAARAAVDRRRSEPVGRVRLTASVPTAQFYLADRLPELAIALPRIDLELDVTDRFVDLVQESFDIALRSHLAPLPDSSLQARTVAKEPIIFVAAPAYLARTGPPMEPSDLTQHDGLWAGSEHRPWRLFDSAGRSHEALPRRRYVANETLCLLGAAKQQLGIAALPAAFVRQSIAAGDLVQVLPDWTAGEITTTVLTTHRRGQLPSVRAVVDFLCSIERGILGKRKQ